jgi:hypothetical protein
LGALGERLGQGHPLDGFDPEAFQHGAYGTNEPAAEAEERRGRDRTYAPGGDPGLPDAAARPPGGQPPRLLERVRVEPDTRGRPSRGA